MRSRTGTAGKPKDVEAQSDSRRCNIKHEGHSDEGREDGLAIMMTLL